MTAASDAATGGSAPTSRERVFLVVVDESEEQGVALRYAARRARHTGGRVALLYVVEPTDLQQWLAVETLMREERREEAEAVLHRYADEVAAIAGSLPILYIREGRRSEALLALIDEAPEISILVLAASTGSEGPGPLITALTGKTGARLRVPLTIVPGNLSDDDIDALA